MSKQEKNQNRNKLIRLNNILLFSLSISIFACSDKRKSVQEIGFEISKNEKEKFRKNYTILNRLTKAFILNEKDSYIEKLKNQINCTDIIKNESGELVFYFKNSTYESCAIGIITYVYLYSENDYSNIYSNLVKYERLDQDYVLQIYFPDF